MRIERWRGGFREAEALWMGGGVVEEEVASAMWIWNGEVSCYCVVDGGGERKLLNWDRDINFWDVSMKGIWNPKKTGMKNRLRVP